MADAFEPAEANPEDAAWERLCRKGLAALDDDLMHARQYLGEALALARRNFLAGDPRLAASLAAQAWLQRADAPTACTTALFEEACAQWAQSDVWLTCEPSSERLARSSSFHLRLESKHPGAYQRRRAAIMRSLLAEGKAHAEALRDQQTAPNEVGSRLDTPLHVSRKLAMALDLLRNLRRQRPPSGR